MQDSAVETINKVQNSAEDQFPTLGAFSILPCELVSLKPPKGPCDMDKWPGVVPMTAFILENAESTNNERVKRYFLTPGDIWGQNFREFLTPKKIFLEVSYT